jgi:lipoate---protein ligase
MMIKADNVYKSKKLIRISLTYNDENKLIHSITITGDFFLYPEESLDQLESSLIGTKMDKYTLRETIEKALGQVDVFGFDPYSLTDAILGCLKAEQDISEIGKR